jgi:RNA polymerase sigma-70 factor, ECF subfamily
MNRAAAPRKGISDEARLAALGAGDLSALGALYDDHAAVVRGFLLRATGDPSTADDLTHDAFLALVDAAKRYDGAHPPRSFVLGIAAKLLLRRRRRFAVYWRRLAVFAGLASRADESTPERVAGASEELARFQAALGKLSTSHRVVVLLADVQGLSGREIADALDVPLATVWTRLHYARRALASALRRKGPS